MVRTIGGMPQILVFGGGLGWLLVDLAQDRFAVCLWAASGPWVEEMSSEQPQAPDCRKEGEVVKMNVGLR
jgi:hypothetical protein